MSMISPAAGRAMVVQLNRTRRSNPDQAAIADLRAQLAKAERERDTARIEVERLAAENETLRASVLHSASTNVGEGMYINGRKVVNQEEAALILGFTKKQQYKISRWLKAGKFETVAVPGRKNRLIYADSLHKPERGKPGRKKK